MISQHFRLLEDPADLFESMAIRADLETGNKFQAWCSIMYRLARFQSRMQNTDAAIAIRWSLASSADKQQRQNLIEQHRGTLFSFRRFRELAETIN